MVQVDRIIPIFKYHPEQHTKKLGMPYRFAYPRSRLAQRYGQRALTIATDLPEIEETRNWCLEKFGKAHGTGRRWQIGKFASEFWIGDERDAFEFRLRWC